ncbi:HNH endonuclease [Roseiflexus sp.]|uniref:HNH endonuclease n=1 Tax=Roseiflexus sp. TaxID=2562120 RepID=UPI00398A7BDE
MRSDRQQPSHHDGSGALRVRRLAVVQRGWQHERGGEAVESLALIAGVLALLAAISVVFHARAVAIGDAAIATFTHWLAGVSGVASVEGSGGIAAPQVQAPPQSVVSLPHLLEQVAPAAPWAERALGIAGSLLTGIVAWVAVAQPASQHTSDSWFSQAGAALRWMGEQTVGVVVGMFEGLYDTVVGLVTLVVDLVKIIAGDRGTQQKYAALIDALITDPLGTVGRVLWSIVEPIATDWQESRYGEAIGRVVFELLPAILAIFTGGVTAAGYVSKVGTVGKGMDALGDAGRIMNHIDDAARIANRIDDAGRIANRIDDAGRIANRIDNAGDVASRVNNGARGVSQGNAVSGAAARLSPSQLRQLRRQAGTVARTGVPYDEFGFPIFDSFFDFDIPSHLRGSRISDTQQMSAATRALREMLDADPDIARKMGLTAEQLEAIRQCKPRIPGFTWHHHQDGRTLQLVDRSIHTATPHIGGRAVTGGRP